MSGHDVVDVVDTTPADDQHSPNHGLSRCSSSDPEGPSDEVSLQPQAEVSVPTAPSQPAEGPKGWGVTSLKGPSLEGM